MLLRAIKTPGLAHLSYVLGHEGRAAVIDPRRDVDVYVEVLREEGLALDYVVETHRQEDFVLGSAALAARAGARVATGLHPRSTHARVLVPDGEELALGGLKLRALHTPGHTPESTSWAVVLPEGIAGVFTGDALFVGQTGRTDLLGRAEEDAGRLYDALRAKLLPLGDDALVWPAHGAGTVCGRGLADRDFSTIGLERRTNPVFTRDRAAFVAEKAAERLPFPPWFARVAAINARGGEAWSEPLVPPVDEVEGALIVDTRSPEAWAGGHVPGSYSVWREGLAVFAGWVVPPDQEVVLVVDRAGDAPAAAVALARVGLDRVSGFVVFDRWRTSGRPIGRGSTITSEELAVRLGGLTVLDVRDEAEFDAGHVPGAVNVYVGHLEERLPSLRLRGELAVTCSVGHRGALGASVLARHGIRAHNVLGGMQAYPGLVVAHDLAEDQVKVT